MGDIELGITPAEDNLGDLENLTFEDLFKVAQRFSFGNRTRRFLEGGTEAATVALPDQHPLWAVGNFDRASYESAERLARMMSIIKKNQSDREAGRTDGSSAILY